MPTMQPATTPAMAAVLLLLLLMVVATVELLCGVGDGGIGVEVVGRGRGEGAEGLGCQGEGLGEAGKGLGGGGEELGGAGRGLGGAGEGFSWRGDGLGEAGKGLGGLDERLGRVGLKVRGGKEEHDGREPIGYPVFEVLSHFSYCGNIGTYSPTVCWSACCLLVTRLRSQLSRMESVTHDYTPQQTYRPAQPLIPRLDVNNSVEQPAPARERASELI